MVTYCSALIKAIHYWQNNTGMINENLIWCTINAVKLRDVREFFISVIFSSEGDNRCNESIVPTLWIFPYAIGYNVMSLCYLEQFTCSVIRWHLINFIAPFDAHNFPIHSNLFVTVPFVISNWLQIKTLLGSLKLIFFSHSSSWTYTTYKY